MKQYFFLAGFCALSFVGLAQSPKALDSKIRRVTVFLRGAQVERVVKTNVNAGTTEVVLSGLSHDIDPKRIQAKSGAKFAVTGVKYRHNFLSELPLPPLAKRWKDSLESARAKHELEIGQLDIIKKEEAMILSNQKIGGANQNIEAEELEAVANFFKTRLSSLLAERIKKEKFVRELEEKIRRYESQLNEQTQGRPNGTGEITLTVRAAAPTLMECAVSYIVRNARWEPTYELRAKDVNSPIQLVYKANVFQQTGEAWDNVSLTLSTQNPALGAFMPELSPWRLNVATPIEAQQRAILKRAKSVEPMAMMAAPPASMELDAAAEGYAANAAAQSAVSASFPIDAPQTVPSGKDPLPIEIRAHQIAASYRYEAIPKLDGDAFLVANIVGWEKYELMPGEASIFFDGEWVSNTNIDPNQSGDTLSVSLGRDTRIVVKREKSKDYAEKTFVGGSARETHRWEISARNTKNETIKITLQDQIPISQNEQIEVELKNKGGAQYNETTGKLSWELSLAPTTTQTVKFQYEVKYPKGARVIGLR